MKPAPLLAALFIAACAPLPPADPGRPGEVAREFTDAAIRADVEGSVRERFGAAAFERALRAEASIMAKLYQGLPLPPTRQPDGSWLPAPIPTLLLVREAGQWRALTTAGERPASAAWAGEVEGLLRSAAYWAEPRRVAQGGCTDGGSSLLVIRYPGRGDTVRQGTCGGPPLYSRLVSAAFAVNDGR